jgi:hypothetical protein
MVEDIYKSFFHDFGWSRGVHAYLRATAGTVIEELQRRGFVRTTSSTPPRVGRTCRPWSTTCRRSSTCWDDGAGPDASRQRRTVNSTAAGR